MSHDKNNQKNHLNHLAKTRHLKEGEGEYVFLDSVLVSPQEAMSKVGFASSGNILFSMNLTPDVAQPQQAVMIYFVDLNEVPVSATGRKAVFINDNHPNYETDMSVESEVEYVLVEKSPDETGKVKVHKILGMRAKDGFIEGFVGTQTVAGSLNNLVVTLLNPSVDLIAHQHVQLRLDVVTGEMHVSNLSPHGTEVTAINFVSEKQHDEFATMADRYEEDRARLPDGDDDADGDGKFDIARCLVFPEGMAGFLEPGKELRLHKDDSVLKDPQGALNSELKEDFVAMVHLRNDVTPDRSRDHVYMFDRGPQFGMKRFVMLSLAALESVVTSGASLSAVADSEPGVKIFGPNQRINLGRSIDYSNVGFSEAVSDKHVDVITDEEGLRLIDLMSKNGTSAYQQMTYLPSDH